MFRRVRELARLSSLTYVSYIHEWNKHTGHKKSTPKGAFFTFRTGWDRPGDIFRKITSP